MLCRRWISFFSVNLKNWTYSTHYFSHALLPNSILFDSESGLKYCKILLEEVYMLEQVTTLEETKPFSCSVLMSRMPLASFKLFI